jgi:hypothetical protein
MMDKDRMDWALGGLAAAGAGCFALRLALGAIDPQIGAVDPALLKAAALVKLFLLGVGCVFAWKAAHGFEAGQPMRPAWGLLGTGLLMTVLGQAGYAPYQLLGREAPFPSYSDVLFIASYPCFMAALLAFLRAYRIAGLPMGSGLARGLTAVAVVAFGVVITSFVLVPLWALPAAPLARALNVAYPALDLLLLAPTVVLVRVMIGMRGGSLWRVWVAILGGFVFMSAGDILYAYFSMKSMKGLDPLIHASFLLSYGLLALGARRQLRILTPE